MLAITACSHAIPRVCRSASDDLAVVNGSAGEKLDAILKSELENGVFNGTVFVSEQSNVILNRGYGCADQQTGLANSPAIISDIGSVAKTFTAVAVLMLEAEGKLSINDPLSTFFPDVPIDKQDITIAQLMVHSSGLGQYVANSDFSSLNRLEAEKRAFEEELRFVPGTTRKYSNNGYSILAAIIERVTDAPFQDYIRQRIFLPLDLGDTGFYRDKHIDADLVARGYPGTWFSSNNGSKTFHRPLTWALAGGGGIVSNVSDLRKWMQALVAVDSLFPPAIQNKAFKDIYVEWRELKRAAALGSWNYITLDGESVVAMGGANDFGNLTQIYYLPEHDRLIIVLLSAYSGKYGLYTAQKIARRMIGHTETTVR